MNSTPTTSWKTLHAYLRSIPHPVLIVRAPVAPRPWPVPRVCAYPRERPRGAPLRLPAWSFRAIGVPCTNPFSLIEQTAPVE